jgi:hypothetical protein
MEKFYKPTKEDLKPLLDQIGDLASWELKFIKSLNGFLEKNPLRYRGYGPYWWLVKQALIEHGINQFGDELDNAAAESMDYGNRAINLVAAHAYSEITFDQGLMTSNSHQMETTDGESIEYIVADDEMEMLHMVKQL